MALAPEPAAVERILGGLHEWRDVQGVIRTIFQALCDVAHAQSNAVREVERRTGEMQEELIAGLGRKADLSDLRDTQASQAEETQCLAETQRHANEEVQALRAAIVDLRAAIEKQRADVQQWRAGFEAGLAHEVQAIQQEMKELAASAEEKANPTQLKEIVREAWTKEEGHLARLHKLCESKVSVADFASLAAVAEGKASLADVDAAVQRQVNRRLQSLVTDQQLVSRADVAAIQEAAMSDVKDRLRECERKMEELSRRHQRNATTADELRSELKALSATKLARPEAEALVAGALADWVRAAQAGADAVQNAVAKGRALCEVSGRSFEGLDVSFGTSLNDSWIQTAEDAARSQVPTPSRQVHQMPSSPSVRMGSPSRWSHGRQKVPGSPGARVVSSQPCAAEKTRHPRRLGDLGQPLLLPSRSHSVPTRTRARSSDRR
mmetsp:Transcript_25454/g.52308  ORF Transcript_25454/g.52308 Transcript_25454/m.52308 type:complete len:438 (+) Transcript_25454:29-1342(+)